MPEIRLNTHFCDWHNSGEENQKKTKSTLQKHMHFAEISVEIGQRYNWVPL